MRFELLVANQRGGLGPQVLNGARKLLCEVIVWQKTILTHHMTMDSAQRNGAG